MTTKDYKAKHPRCEVWLCSEETTDVHHIKTRGSGGRDIEVNYIALCREHHTEAHTLGRVRFPARYALQDRWAAAFEAHNKEVRS